MPKQPATIAQDLSLRSLALAATAFQVLAAGDAPVDAPEMQFLQHQLELIAPHDRACVHSVREYLAQPAMADMPLLHLASKLALNHAELLTIALVLAVESDVMAGRAVARVQAPLGGSRPTLGLLSSAFAPLGESGVSPMEALLAGNALRSGLLLLLNEGAPLAERAVSIPVPLCLALNGHDSQWPGVQVGMGSIPDIALSVSIRHQAELEAAGLGEDSLVLRSGSASEARSVACAIAEAIGRRAVFVSEAGASAGGSALTPGFVPWLILGSMLPVFCFELGPGERKPIPPLPLYKGPVLAICGPEGTIEAHGESPRSWSIPVPPAAERKLLWQNALGSETLAADIARHHRHGCGRIAHLARLAHRNARLRGHEDGEPSPGDLAEAAWTGEGSGLDPLAQPLRDRIPDDALVTPPGLRQELDRLYLRCRSRDGLIEGLGVSTVTRYRPGVRALFVGASGTGKTLAAGWLATRLGLPLFRVDLASVTSKYIGETEKNLANLLARAEHAEVVLLFDEADSLFAKRTDVKEANDRFANAQTNYLLQRIETFDGITILTSNSRARFDNAFARRIDLVLEFPLPGPQERRSLWQSHLGRHHTLALRDLNRLAAIADVCGGNIRNVVLSAAVLAHHEDRRIEYRDIVEALAGEYRKLGRQMPVELMN